MTRGKIIYVSEKGMMYYTCEFNGDMHPTVKGDQIIEKFQGGGFRSVDDFEQYVERFNKRNFGYDIPLVERSQTENYEMNIDKNYTDYLYVFNGLPRDFSIISQGEKYMIPIAGMAIVNFNKIDEILVSESSTIQ